MSKTIEDKAQEFAEINEDNKCNYSFSYNKYDIANAFQKGAEFGYALAENRMKKEYEWKLRWIPISEKMPEPRTDISLKLENLSSSEITGFMGYSGEFYIKLTDIIDCDNVKLKSKVTHWRSFL